MSPPEIHKSVIDKEFFEEFIHDKCVKQLGHSLIEKMENEGAITKKIVMDPNPTLRMSVDCVYGEEYLELKNKIIEQDNRIKELEYDLKTLLDNSVKELEKQEKR